MGLTSSVLSTLVVGGQGGQGGQVCSQLSPLPRGWVLPWSEHLHALGAECSYGCAVPLP